MTDLNKTFYGTTIGFGLDFRQKPERKGYWTFAILLPLRGSSVNDYMNHLESDYNVVFKNDLPPVGISFGYRMVIGD